MSIKEFVGKRCLVRFPNDLWNKTAATEVSIIEISPSGQWTKIYYDNSGNFDWRPTKEVYLVEELGMIEPFREVTEEDL